MDSSGYASSPCRFWMALVGGEQPEFEFLRNPFHEAPLEDTLWTLGSGGAGEPPTASAEHGVREDILIWKTAQEKNQTLGTSVNENICVNPEQRLCTCVH